MKTKVAAAVAALALGVTALATSPAEAHHPHFRVGPGGFIAGAIIGATIASEPYYVTSCHWVRQYDEQGRYLGRAKFCG